jgi:hypothetical protein
MGYVQVFNERKKKWVKIKLQKPKCEVIKESRKKFEKIKVWDGK